MSPRNLLVTFVSSLLMFTASPTFAQSPEKPEAQEQEAQKQEDAGPVVQDNPPSAQKLAEQKSSTSGQKDKKAFPQDVAGLQQMAIEAYQDQDYMRFVQANIKLREQRPYEPQYMVGMVIGAALIGKPQTAYNYMHVMQQQGLSYDFNSTEDTVSIRTPQVYGYLNDLLIKQGQPMGEGSVAFTLPESALRPEAIAWDEARGRFLVGTVDTGVVLAVTPDGKAEEILKAGKDNGLMAINGIAVDQARKKLWIATAGLPGFAALAPADLGRGALLEFHLETLEPLGRFDIPADGVPHVPGSVVVTPSGDVYLIDRAVPVLYRKPVGQPLAAFLGNPGLVGLRDLAISADGSKLYVADAAMGVMVVDVVNGKASMLTGPETLNLTGISGIMYSEGKLLVLQNGITPQRLMRLDLDPTGMAVAKVTPLAIALEPFNAPAFGVVQGGEAYYFASSNLSDAGVKPTVVLKTPIQLSKPIEAVDYTKFKQDTFGADGKPGPDPAPTPLKPGHSAPESADAEPKDPDK